MAWPLIFGAFCAWDIYEDLQRQKHAINYQHWPLPAERDRRFDVSNVSLIVPTQLECGESIKTAIGTWLANEPGEIIFVTREDKEEELRILLSDVVTGATNISIHTVQQYQKRDQLVLGINKSQGSILALVDDDAFWKSEVTLSHLLAPFQNDDVGLVSGPIKSYVPDDRRRPDVITAWEVAAFRVREKRDGAMKAAFAADGGTNFCLSGVTMLLRAEILKSEEFQEAFTKETWMGKRVNSGDDSFITRWVLFHEHLNHRMHRSNASTRKVQNGLPSETPDELTKRWKLGVQHTPESIVETSLHPNSKYLGQLKRWYRSGLRLRLTCLTSEPGWHTMKTSKPYMARKMVEGTLSPVLSWLRLFVCVKSIKTTPRLAGTVLLIHTYIYFKDLMGFFQRFPWCRSKWWAPLISDRLYFISDLYCWYTIRQESWETRPAVDEDMNKEESRASDTHANPSSPSEIGNDNCFHPPSGGGASSIATSQAIRRFDSVRLGGEQKATSSSSSTSRANTDETAAVTLEEEDFAADTPREGTSESLSYNSDESTETPTPNN